MPLSEQQKLYVSWFALHDKDAAKAKEQKWHKMSAGDKVFYLWERVLEVVKGRPAGASPYRIILGYTVDAGKLKCRMWYYSGSEANWRAFTGYRSNGAWTKGAEYDKSQPVCTYTHMGYINECFVTPEMHQSLQLFWNQQKCQHEYESICPWPKPPNCEPKLAEDRKVFEYMVGLPTKSVPCKLGEIYNGERQFKLANLPENVDKATSDLTKETGSTTIQEHYDVGLKGRIGVGHELKHDTNLYTWIKTCLANQVSAVQQYHPVLKIDYTVWSYTLKGNAKGGDCADDLIVEIAAGNSPKQHQYQDYTGTVQTVDTPVCWVRDVYYKASPTSSFGNRAHIPVNLAFLVQKPCDYLKQTSDYYATKTNIEFTDSGKNKKFTDITAINILGGGKYINLSMVNEATSPLIKAFKDGRSYPRFREKYHKAKVAYNMVPVALPMLMGVDGLELDDRVYFLKRLVTMGIDEYLNIRCKAIKSSYGSSGHHGDAGLTRAAELNKAVQACTTTQDVSKKMYDCFINNKIGTFSGGFFSKIRTEPTSLFTCICRYLLTAFVDPGPSGVKAPVPIHWSKLTLQPGLKGSEHSIDRMAYYIHNSPIPVGQSESLHVTNEAPRLLDALKGEK